MSCEAELYRAARAVDAAARLTDPLHAMSDAIIPAAEFKALCRALRAWERAAASPTPDTAASTEEEKP